MALDSGTALSNASNIIRAKGSRVGTISKFGLTIGYEIHSSHISRTQTFSVCAVHFTHIRNAVCFTHASTRIGHVDTT